MTSLTWADRILDAIAHIHAHLDEPLNPAKLAEVAGFSKHHFHRVFHGMVGRSVMTYVRELRLDRAALKLEHGRAPVTEIAFDSGYESHEAFTRAFRARFGRSPSMHRARASALECQVEFKELERRELLAMRYVGPFSECGVAWQPLLKHTAQAGLTPFGRPSFGLVYDDPEITPESECRYDACIEVPIPDEIPPPLYTRTIEAGRYAVALHRGPYHTILMTYVTLLGRWLPSQNVELADAPIIEVYLNTPMDTAPEDLLTEVCVRVQ